MEDCKLWTLSTDTGGYGQRRHEGKLVLVHRLAYCEANGIPLEEIKGSVIMHTCDTPACYNPDHLKQGTQKNNVDDMWAKGRGKSPGFQGEKHGMAKLTQEQVAEIRTRYAAGGVYQRELAKEFNVVRQHISAIVTGKFWRQA